MNEIVYVNTGEVKLGDKNVILNSGAIGSCVVVCMYDALLKTGAMAHIMLPGAAPQGQEKNTRYASEAIQRIIELMNKDHSIKWESFIIGGANVLKRPNDTISRSNIDSVEQLLDQHGIKASGKVVGGYERRTVVFDIARGCINYTEGESKQKNLWETGREINAIGLS